MSELESKLESHPTDEVIRPHYIVCQHLTNPKYDSIEEAERVAKSLSNDNQDTYYVIYVAHKVFKTEPRLITKTLSGQL